MNVEIPFVIIHMYKKFYYGKQSELTYEVLRIHLVRVWNGSKLNY
jgi:hypothetical protein